MIDENVVLLCIVALVVGALPAACAAGVPAPVDLTVGEGFRDPIGFYDATPTFSWKLPPGAGVERQTGYQLVVSAKSDFSRSVQWDSGKVDSPQSVFVPYQGQPLQSRQRAYWRVRYWDGEGAVSDWSKAASFELGLLSNEDWEGQWVRLQTAQRQTDNAPEIEILQARYGVAGDDTRQKDIAAQLRKLLAAGITSFQVTNDLAGGDPAYGVVKTLELKYRVGDATRSASLKENEGFDLATGKASAAEQGTFVPEYLRREFEVEAPLASARLHVTARGLYEVHLNGKRIGGDYMVPGWTPYHKRIETLTYDVSEYLHQGANALGAILGEGWYAGRLMSKRKPSYPAVRPALLLQLEITYPDGTTQVVATDSHWKATNNGPIRFSGIYDGEVYDARMELPGWDQTGYDDSAWAPVEAEAVTAEVPLVPKRHSPVRLTDKLPTRAVTEPAPGRFVFDLGQNMVGWPELKIPVHPGQTITVRVAEMLNKDGTLYTANYRGAKSRDLYTAATDGTVTWHPTFTFHGFRYVELSGFPEGTQPQTDWVTGCVLHSDFPQTGKFVSSHAKLNQLQRNITWGQRGNYLDIPTDCPQRDERLGWTGDAQVFCPTSIFNYGVHAFWASWLQSVGEDQRDNGLVPHVVPDVLGGAGSPGWGDVAVTSPWDVYVRTGDLDLLRDNYPMMERWTAAYAREAKGFIVNRGGFGDWLQPYAKAKGNRGDTPADLIATAYFGRCSAIMRQAAKALGKSDDVKRYAAQFASIRQAFTEKFFDADGRLTTSIPTQTAYLMALGFDLLKPELRDGATQGLLQLVKDADGHLRTGFLGTPLLAFVLDDCGHTEVAYEVLFKETYPSWFYSINQGATTMWERWNSYSHTDGFGNAGMNSFNHYAYGAIGQWMYERLAGLAPDPEHPGYKHFFIQPRPGGPLTAAEAELETPYGAARSGWKVEGDELTLTAVVPPNTTATLVLPGKDGAAPSVSRDGKTVQMTAANGRFQHPLTPGTHTFQAQNWR